MISRLRGTLVETSDDQLIIDVGGVGYQLTATVSVLEQVSDLGEEFTLVVHTDVKETSITLYAFCDHLEKHVFLLLQKVKGIGSKLAMSIVSAVGAQELLAAIGRSDVSALRRLPGVGRKTAERLIVELRESVGELAQASPMASRVETIDQKNACVGSLGFTGEDESSDAGSVSDAMLALEKLGFAGELARRAVADALTDFPEAHPSQIDAGELLRHALAKL